MAGDVILEHFKVDHISDAWKTLVENVAMKGDRVSPRGIPSKELEDVILEYPRVKGYTFINKRRRINPVFHLVELFYFLNGRTDASLLVDYVENMTDFANDVGRFDGSYGPSIYESLPFAIYELNNDRDSRRAVVPILRSHHLNPNSLDIPCNIFLGFRIRGNRLNMNVFTRSQDLFRGFLYDTLEFQLLQLFVSKVLKVDPGSYTHHILSLHLYRKDFSSALESLVEPSNGSDTPIVPDFSGQDTFWQYARTMGAVCEWTDFDAGFTSDDMRVALTSYRKRTRNSYKGLYSQWVNWWLETRSNAQGA